ncbi:hypothetical protein BH10ACI1_BH10ACI1_06640 [soil metagenome]
MNYSSYFQKFAFLVFVSIVLIAVIFALSSPPKTESAKRGDNSETLSNYDIRTNNSETTKQAIEQFIAQSGKTNSLIESDRRRAVQAETKLRSDIPALKIEYNEDLRIPEVVSPDFSSPNSKFLTTPSNKKRGDILREFIIQNSELFGLNQKQITKLENTADYTNPDGNLSFVEFAQKINSIPVFRGEIKAGFTKKNELVRVINNLAPSLDYERLSNDFGRAELAVEYAANHINLQANAADTKRIEAESDDLKITFERGQFSDKTTAEKMYFPIDYGVARAAWRVLLWTKTDAYYVIVDAETGTLLWSKDITNYQTQTATYGVYTSFFNFLRLADSPTPFSPGCLDPNNCPQPAIISRGTITLIGNESPYTFNDLGWIPDNGLPVRTPADPNVTDGNAVEAGIDRDGTQGVDAPVSGNPNRVFNFTYNPTPGNPAPGESPLTPDFQKGSVTQAFYTVNRWHDEMYRLGFTEQARNFQHFNFGRGGAEGDRVSAEIQDSSGTNSANASTPADGGRLRLQMFIWTGTTPNRDGALDGEILLHEITHGLSNRLIGNATGLNSPMAQGMGEGWSDFYALALLSEPNDSPAGIYPIGSYASFGAFGTPGDYYYGLRRFPTATIGVIGANGFPHNPLTLANLNAGNCAVFNGAFAPRFTNSNCSQPLFIGEVWGQALWEVRFRLVQRLGHGNGNRKALQIITDAMKLSPLNPTILQSRDAIIAAASASSVAPEAAIDAADVWRGFARRGIGFSAQINTTNPLNFTEAFNLPPQFRRPTRADFDGDGKSDLSVFRPSEGNWYLNRSTQGFSVVKWGLSTDQLVPSDYDGDGKTDFAIFRPNADSNQPDFYILNSANFTVSGFSWGIPGDIPVVEDYDGDGKDDIAIVRPTPFNFLWYVQKSGGGVQIYNDLSFLQSSPIPVAGDFDGDGNADLAARIIFNGGYYWYLRLTSGNPIVQFAWGLTGDKVVTGDYDGDEIDDVAVYRPSNGTWYIRRTSGGSIAVQFGISTDIPAPADYDGDGKTDIAVYRDGTWYINQSTNGLLITQFGLNNDMPIANRYLP